MLIGRVESAYGLKGTAEFTSNVRIGDFVFYFDSNGNQVLCQVSSISSAPMKGLHGNFRVIDQDGELPKTFTDLYSAQVTFDSGQIEIGKDKKGNVIKLGINGFFLNVYVAGMTGQGKTHTLLVILEETAKIKIPAVVWDLNGEMANLNLFSENVIVTTDMAFEDVIGHLKERRTVVFNLQGLPDDIKRARVYEFTSRLMDAKEKDYTQAGTDLRNLELPPILTFIDEAEIVAPDRIKEYTADAIVIKSKAILIAYAKRGSKYGLGLVVASQVVPDLALEIRSQCNSAILFRVCESKDQCAFRKLKYISTIEIKKIKDMDREYCLIAGELVRHPIGPIHIRDIQTKRTKTRDFEAILGIASKKVEIKPVIIHHDDVHKPDEENMLPCPECKKPMKKEYNKIICDNEDCDVLEIVGGKIIYSSLSKKARKIIKEAPKVEVVEKRAKPGEVPFMFSATCNECGLPKGQCICRDKTRDERRQQTAKAITQRK